MEPPDSRRWGLEKSTRSLAVSLQCLGWEGVLRGHYGWVGGPREAGQWVPPQGGASLAQPPRAKLQ